MSTKLFPSKLSHGLALASFILIFTAPVSLAAERPKVIEIDLKGMVNQVTAEYVIHGIHHANQVGANAVLLELNTPGGLETSMRKIIETIFSSRVPVITYVAPSGGRAASAGFFILLSGDLAVMAPGTNTGAAHPVMMGGADIGKTEAAKVENDAAAYIRSISSKRGRNEKLAEEGVRKSSSFTDQEALNGNLVDAIASSPEAIFAKFNGRTIERFNGTTTTLHLKDAVIEPFRMSSEEVFLAWISDPNIAFLLGALGLIGLYFEFTHPGSILPGVVGAAALVMALYAFNLLPINYAGVILIILALVLIVLEVKVGSHGILAVGGIIALVVGALILVKSPLPGARIKLSTALGAALPLAVITLVLVKLAVSASRRKAMTGEVAMLEMVGVAKSDLEPLGKVMVRGELWDARSDQKILAGTRVRVRRVDGFTLIVEPEGEQR